MNITLPSEEKKDVLRYIYYGKNLSIVVNICRQS